VLLGGPGNDPLSGGAGDDLLQGGGGNNTLDGGAGNNTASYANAPSGVTVNLATGTAANGYGGTDTLTSIESVTGSAFNDTLIGDAGDNSLSGGAGNDTLIGGAGNNALDGGAGTDTVDYSGAPGGVRV
jgi:Ca2+-binding RTX toxin-like protein